MYDASEKKVPISKLLGSEILSSMFPTEMLELSNRVHTHLSIPRSPKVILHRCTCDCEHITHLTNNLKFQVSISELRVRQRCIRNALYMCQRKNHELYLVYVGSEKTEKKWL